MSAKKPIEVYISVYRQKHYAIKENGKKRRVKSDTPGAKKFEDKKFTIEWRVGGVHGKPVKKRFGTTREVAEREAARIKAAIQAGKSADADGNSIHSKAEGWKQYLLASASQTHARLSHAMLLRVIDGTGWRTVDEINSVSFVAWRSTEVTLRQQGIAGRDSRGRLKRPLSAASQNDLRNTLSAFCSWLMSDEGGRCIESNPMASVSAKKGEPTFVRRALTFEEANYLFKHLKPKYHIAYAIMLTSAWRRGETASLKWKHAFLDVQTPHLCLEADLQKSGRSDAVALHPDVVSILREEKRRLGTDYNPEDAIGCVVVPSIGTHKRALAKARKQYLEEAASNPLEYATRESSNFCLYQDQFKRKIDTHSLRTTVSTSLQQIGEGVETAQLVLRHTSPQLTRNSYTDKSQLLAPMGASIARLHLPPIQAVVAHTTDGSKSESNFRPQVPFVALTGIQWPMAQSLPSAANIKNGSEINAVAASGIEGQLMSREGEMRHEGLEPSTR